MQFFYIDYMNDGKKERNIGFLRVEADGVCVGLRGVPTQCGDRCRVYAVNICHETALMGEIPIRSGYGMAKLKWNAQVDPDRCLRVEIPLYGTRKGVCVLRNETEAMKPENRLSKTGRTAPEIRTQNAAMPNSRTIPPVPDTAIDTDGGDIYEEIAEDKWQQLLKLYPEVHICPDAQCILIRPRDAVILTRRYHELASNSFVLHAYYNYRQLLLFRYSKNTVQYYLGVPGVYYEREQRIAQLFGFEGFENGEARMQQDADRKTYKGCFGYYMKRVEI